MRYNSPLRHRTHRHKIAPAVFGDTAQMERLIAHEQVRRPQLPRAAAPEVALDRWAGTDSAVTPGVPAPLKRRDKGGARRW
jgi:hypothetical protein